MEPVRGSLEKYPARMAHHIAWEALHYRTNEHFGFPSEQQSMMILMLLFRKDERFESEFHNHPRYIKNMDALK